LCRRGVLAGVIVAALLGTAGDLMAQAFKDVQTPDTPLVLKAQGSFFVGGEKVEQTQGELGNLGPGGHIAVNQMYVRYMVPQGGDGNLPVVMVHGATLTGKSWETTPDGRMGWDEYFVRKGHAVYVPDQVGRGRSGFNQAVFNNVRAGATPPANQPVWLRFSDEGAWPNFRFGPNAGAGYPDNQFPVSAVDELAKQGVPDVSFGGIPIPNPTLKALSDLAAQLHGAVLMGHSQSGSFPLDAALIDPAATRGLVLVEPGSCPARYTTEQIATLAKVPILVVFGDHRDTPTGIPTLLAFNIGLVTWETIVVIHKGANYGYPLREGTQSMSPTNGMGPLPADDVIPIHVSDTVTRGTVKPSHPVIQYPHNREAGGDALANGFVYRGQLIPALRDKFVFGDITTGRIWYANRADVLAADDGNPMTVAPIYEMDVGLRRITEETFRERGGKGEALPGMGAIAGRGRVDLRFSVDNDGELYILTKSDGMIRKVVGARVATAPTAAANEPPRVPVRPSPISQRPV
jgi:pimeloyl-ACP methyl ester carboxylesterase